MNRPQKKSRLEVTITTYNSMLIYLLETLKDNLTSEKRYFSTQSELLENYNEIPRQDMWVFERSSN